MLAIACGLLAGCAVTTVDVDVYKGPLVNDEGVQTEQTVAMAIAAKPLLTQLRDQLEWPDKIVLDRKLAETVPNYSPGAMKGGFKNPLAARANAILSLYDDRTDEMLQSLLSQGRAALEHYQDAYQAFREAGPGADERWLNLRNSMKSDVREKSDASPDSSDPTELILYGYRELYHRTGHYDPTKRYEQWLAKGHLLLARAAEKTSEASAAATAWKLDLTSRELDVPTVDPKRTVLAPANQVFGMLADPEVARKDADFLFPEAESKSKDDFVNEVTRTGKAFLQARQSLEQLWKVTLDLIIYVNECGGIDTTNRCQASDGLTDLAIALIDPFALAQALAVAETDTSTSADAPRSLIAALRKRYIAVTGADAGAHASSSGSTPANQFVVTTLELVKEELQKNPAVTADRLLLVHGYFKSLQVPNEIHAINYASQRPGMSNTSPALHSLPEKRPPVARAYGLVRGPTASPSELALFPLAERVLDPFFLTERWQTATSRIGLGLERGRLDFGIDRLTEDYLSASFQGTLDRSKDKVIAIKRERLLNALAGFSEKVRFLANNSALLEDQPTGARRQSFAAQRDYTRVLQAVGNSVQAQVDELRHQANFHEADEGNGNAEAVGMFAVDKRLALPPTTKPTPRSGLADGLNLRGGNPTTQPTRRQVMDQLLDKLRYEYVQVVRSNGSKDPRAQYVLDAIEFLHGERAGAVYIRPPAAFLRNSYPVTSFQSTSQGLWTNQLSRQAARGMPFAEFIRDNVYDQKSAKDAKIQADIDKQFWQNINRIRVAGAGRTNYVIAKDDVGNWYVKGYSADPRDIIESARAMAGFAIGSPVSSSAIEAAMQNKKSVDNQGNKVVDDFNNSAHDNPATKPSTKDQKPSAAEQRAQNTALHNFESKQKESADTAYKSRLDELNKKLDETMVDQLKNAVSVAWHQQGINDTGLDSAAATATEKVKQKLKAAATQPATTTEDLEAQVRGKLSALAEYRNVLLGEIFAPPATQPANPAAATQAVAAATQASDQAVRAANAATRAASQATDAAGASTRAVDAAQQAGNAATQAADSADHAADKSKQAAADVIAATQATGAATTQKISAATQEADDSKKLAVAATQQAGTARQSANAATTQATAATQSAASSTQESGTALKLADQATKTAADSERLAKEATAAPKETAATKPTTQTTHVKYSETRTTSTATTTHSTTDGLAKDTKTTMTVEKVIEQSPPASSASKKQYPAVQPSPPDEQDSSDKATQQKNDAFRIAAETLRGKLQPLINDGLDAVREYETELGLIEKPTAQ